METISLSYLVEEVISEFILNDPGLRASFEIENNITVKGDYNALKMVIRNLIGNAIRCTMNLHEPLIAFGQIEDEKIYFIMDNGKGFDLETSTMNTHPFHHPSLENQGNELTMVRRIIVKHGGKIWGVTNGNIGAVFYFSLN
jgi:light-regulated signal transduction histidine kinase (bacteriophytochrome)